MHLPCRLNPGEVDYDFQGWRSWYGSYKEGKANLAHSQAKFFDVDPAVANDPWLSVISHQMEGPTSSGQIRKRNVAFIRSHRYPNRHFPWGLLADRYRDNAVCIGTASEKQELYRQFGLNVHAPTHTLLEVAQVIAGCDLVITNQTAGRAIAEALKKPVVMERYEECPNVEFDRPDVWSGDERVLEFIASTDPINKPSVSTPPPIRGVKVA
jgi:hypothetical protein